MNPHTSSTFVPADPTRVQQAWIERALLPHVLARLDLDLMPIVRWGTFPGQRTLGNAAPNEPIHLSLALLQGKTPSERIAFCRQVFVHELSHWLAPHRHHHGPVFLAIYAAMLARLFDSVDAIARIEPFEWKDCNEDEQGHAMAFAKRHWNNERWSALRLAHEAGKASARWSDAPGIVFSKAA